VFVSVCVSVCVCVCLRVVQRPWKPNVFIEMTLSLILKLH
jgi:hypothetical protein